jgi:serine/threonine protein kinase
MEISPDKWEAVKTLFTAARELPAEKRPAFLRMECADSVVREEVDRLLVEYEQAGSMLSKAPFGNPKVPRRVPAFETGQVLAGRFRILRFVAAGGMGEVYEAEDLELRERLAIKTIRPEAHDRSDAIARLKREVHLARKVTHPNACRIFDLFRHQPSASDTGEEIFFVSMEFLHGETLAEQIQRQGRFSAAEALPLVHQMASALSAAHGAGIVHRDFKPSNVVLVEEPTGIRVVVTDFGLAYQAASPSADTALTTSLAQAGTVAYMSPEQLDSHPATTASDIYALGLVMYEMVTGVRPFEGSSFSIASKRLAEPAPSPRKVEPNLSLVFESVVLRCLERDPQKRFAQAKDVSTALMVDSRPNRTSTTGTLSLTGPTPFQAGRGLERWRWLAVSVIALSLLISVIAIRFQISLHRQHPVKPDPSVAATFPDRELRYSIIVQGYRQSKPYGGASRVDERTIFKADQGIQIMFNSPKLGFLYVLNQGPSSTPQAPIFNTLFPSPTANGGSAQLSPGRELKIPGNGLFIFDRPRGTEKLWLVWSDEALPKLEALKKWVNVKDHGTIRDSTEAQYVQSFLGKSVPFSVVSRGDDPNHATTIDGHGKILVHLVKLDHQ